MASLWWRYSDYKLIDVVSSIDEVYGAIVDGLPALGYSGVAKTFDVHAAKNDFVLCILYLPNGNRNYWQIIACGGTASQSEADAEMVKVQTMINNFAFWSPH